MYRFILACVVLAGAAAPAAAWNEKGHMVVARLAWKELNDGERDKVLAILVPIPLHKECLEENRPVGFTEKEWAFMRAATWPDFVRRPKEVAKKFHVRDRHFVNLPFVFPPGSVTPPAGLPAENVIAGIKVARVKTTMGTDREERAIQTAWLMHLVGDVHQPLHCVALFGPEFPDGDRGGTKAQFRRGTKLIELHPFWDGLLGQATSATGIGSTVLEIETLNTQFPDATKADLANHKEPAEWADEGVAAARKHAYLDGKLPLVNVDDHPVVTDISSAPDGYEENAGETARFAIWKAGRRLADLLKEVAAAN